MNQEQPTPPYLGKNLIEAGVELLNRHSGKVRGLMMAALIWDFIARPRRLPAASLHDTVESFEIRSPFPVRKEPGCFKRRDLFGDRGSHELVDAGSILTAQPLDRLLQGARESQRICIRPFHDSFTS